MENEQNDPHLVNKEMINTNVHQLFITGLNEMYATEQFLIKISPHFIDASTSTALRGEIMKHLDKTRVHITRLDTVFTLLDEKPVERNCPVTEAICDEAETLIHVTGRGTQLRDAAVIMAIKRLQYYEYTSYASLAGLADLMEHQGITDLLLEIVQEEKAAYEALNNLEKETVNIQVLKE